MKLLFALAVYGFGAFAEDPVWVVGRGAAAHAVAHALSGNVVVTSELVKPTLFGDRPAAIIHQGPLGAEASAVWRAWSKTRSALINLGDPGSDHDLFRLIVSPRYEPAIAKPNVLRVDQLPSRIGPTSLAQALRNEASPLRHLPHPVIGVLFAGPAESRTYTSTYARALGETLNTYVARHGGSLVLTIEPHATAPAVEAFLAALKRVPTFFTAAGSDEDHRHLLAHADHVIVAGPSAELLAAASASGRPLYVHAPRSTVGPSYQRYVLALVREGRAKFFNGILDAPANPYRPDSAERIAEVIRTHASCPSRLSRVFGRR